MTQVADGPYEACNTSKHTEPYVYGVSGPGCGLGYHAWLGYPHNTFSTFEEAEKAARMMNMAFRAGQDARSAEIKRLIG
ncbi:MAG: hypothetical protein LPK02_07305 [Rhodobacterales bacterium]|nr:hypothetical protein [Rhodobacterales bacterium]